jgi:hypothetical protein
VDSFDDIDDVSFEVEADGRLVRRQLARQVLSRGSWPTALYLYQELDPRTEAWRPAKVALVRFQSKRGQLRKHASITLGAAQAREVAARLTEWLADMPAPGDDDDDDGAAAAE